MRRKSPAGQKPKTPTWVWAVAVIVPLALAFLVFLLVLWERGRADRRAFENEMQLKYGPR